MKRFVFALTGLLEVSSFWSLADSGCNTFGLFVETLMSAHCDLSVKGEHFGVLEVPPACCESDAARAVRGDKLKKYKRIIRTEDFE